MPPGWLLSSSVAGGGLPLAGPGFPPTQQADSASCLPGNVRDRDAPDRQCRAGRAVPEGEPGSGYCLRVTGQVAGRPLSVSPGNCLH